MKMLRILALTLLVASCGPADELSTVARKMTAIESGKPFTVPSQTLISHTGEPFDLRSGTTGRFTLLFFGYTYCPDICPIQVATANAALQGLTEEERTSVVQIFVTMDPQRDSVERLSEWLGAMRSPAIGLRGSTSELEALLAAMGFVMPPMSSRQQLPGGTADDYLVPHPTSLFLITPDGMGRFQYPYDRGTPQQIADDLQRLMALEWP
jgi:protein SCO1/2